MHRWRRLRSRGWIPARPTLRSPHDREIFRLALPALGALIAEPLFLLADTAIIGQLGTPQLAGLSLAGMILQTLLGLFIFLAYATTAAVARELGADNRRGALTYGIDGIWLAVLLGVGLIVVGQVFAVPTIAAFDPSLAVTEHALTYLRISVLGLPAMLVVFSATGVLRGLQDTRTPLLVMAVMSVANVGLNFALVYGFGLGIAGSAIGTVIAQAGAATWLVVVVLRGARSLHAPLVPKLSGLRMVARAGVPLIVRTVTLRAALLVTTYVATAQGDASLAAHHVALTLWNFLSLALDAVAIAGQAMLGRYLGAGDVTGARATTRRMIEWGIAAGAGLGLLLAVTSPLYLPLFTPDPAVQSLVGTVIWVLALFEPIAGVVFVLDGVLIGAGDGRYLAWAGVWNLIAYLPVAAVVYLTDAGLVYLWWAFGVYMIARLVTLGIRARSDRWLVTGGLRRQQS